MSSSYLFKRPQREEDWDGFDINEICCYIFNLRYY